MFKLRFIFKHFLFVALLSAGCTALSFGQEAAAIEKMGEAELIAILQSDAPLKDKMDACRILGRIGTKASIAPLAELLDDAELSHMACYGLEPNPDPVVDEVFRKALGELKGRPLVGVIGSMGMRRNAKAVKPLAEFLNDPDPDVVQMTARSLGMIGNANAARALEKALPNRTGENQLSICEGLFRCAESLTAAGKSKQAQGIYDRLRDVQPAPHQVRAGALRGAILTRGEKGIPLLVEAIGDRDFILAAAAARTAQEMGESDVVEALAEALAKLPSGNQILTIQTLGHLADGQALPAVLTAAKSSDVAVRVAAIRAIPAVGDASAIPALVEMLGDAEASVAQAAKDSLATLAGADADRAVIALAGKDDIKVRKIGIELVGQRRIVSEIPAVLKNTGHADATVRIVSIQALGELADLSHFPAVLDVLMKAKSADEIQAAEAAVTKICHQESDRAACAKQVSAGLADARGATKSALLRVLKSIGTPSALEGIRSCLSDSDSEIKDLAIYILSEWPSVDALSDLKQLAKTLPDTKNKSIALRGVIRLVPQLKVSNSEKLTALKEAMAISESNDEKKLALGALGGIPEVAALSIVTSFIDKVEMRDDACGAAVSIAEKIVESHPAQAKQAMEQAIKTSTNADLVKRAKAVWDKATGVEKK